MMTAQKGATEARQEGVSRREQLVASNAGAKLGSMGRRIYLGSGTSRGPVTLAGVAYWGPRKKAGGNQRITADTVLWMCVRRSGAARRRPDGPGRAFLRRSQGSTSVLCWTDRARGTACVGCKAGNGPSARAAAPPGWRGAFGGQAGVWPLRPDPRSLFRGRGPSPAPRVLDFSPRNRCRLPAEGSACREQSLGRDACCFCYSDNPELEGREKQELTRDCLSR